MAKFILIYCFLLQRASISFVYYKYNVIYWRYFFLCMQALREQLVQLMFENFNVSGFYASEQAVLSLYAVGRISGCTVDIGHGKIGVTISPDSLRKIITYMFLIWCCRKCFLEVGKVCHLILYNSAIHFEKKSGDTTKISLSRELYIMIKSIC